MVNMGVLESIILVENTLENMELKCRRKKSALKTQMCINC